MSNKKKYIYVVELRGKNSYIISHEGYETYEEAENFVLNSEEKPKKIGVMKFASERLVYRIHPIGYWPKEVKLS